MIVGNMPFHFISLRKNNGDELYNLIIDIIYAKYYLSSLMISLVPRVVAISNPLAYVQGLKARLFAYVLD